MHGPQILDSGSWPTLRLGCKTPPATRVSACTEHAHAHLQKTTYLPTYLHTYLRTYTHTQATNVHACIHMHVYICTLPCIPCVMCSLTNASVLTEGHGTQIPRWVSTYTDSAKSISDVPLCISQPLRLMISLYHHRQPRAPRAQGLADAGAGKPSRCRKKDLLQNLFYARWGNKP